MIVRSCSFLVIYSTFLDMLFINDKHRVSSYKAPARDTHDTGSTRSYCSTSENPCDSGNVANVHTDKLANLFQTVGLDVMPTNQPTNHTYHT